MISQDKERILNERKVWFHVAWGDLILTWKASAREGWRGIRERGNERGGVPTNLRGLAIHKRRGW